MSLAFRKVAAFGFALFMACGSIVPAAYAAKPLAAGKIDSKLASALVPHKAVYDIEMVSRHSGSPVLNIKGQLLFETGTGCDAWTTNHNFKLYYEYADNAPLLITSDFSTYESFDGKSFHFSSRRERNGELYEELRGAATHNDDGTGKAVYSMPADLSFDLGPAGLFPMAHTIALLQHIKNKERFFSANVFDGSDDEGPVEINSFIGKAIDMPAGIAKKGTDAALLASPAHKIRMAFFPLKDDKAESDYEMDLIFHENGVISDMLIDYKDFSITQKLVSLEALSPPDCDPSRIKAQPVPKKGN